MGLYLKVMDNDALFAAQKTPPTIINYVRTATTDEKSAFNELIYSVFDGDVMDNVASCECRTLIGASNIGAHCTNCGHPVKSRDLGNIEPLLWIQTPEGNSGKTPKLINPAILEKLCDHFVKNNFSIVRYLVDITYRVECKIPGLLFYLSDKGIQRGYKYFYENYDYVVESLFAHKLFRRKRNQLVEYPIETFLKDNRHITFCDHVPLPNKTMLVIEDTATGSYRDKSIEFAIDAMRTVAGLDLPVKGYRASVKQNRMIKALFLLIDFVNAYVKNCVRGKPGAIRKHVIASRVHFAGRTVITSNTEPHDYEALYYPWGAATSMLRLHLMTKLMAMGMTQREGVSFLNKHAAKYHPLLDRLFKELINESDYKGIPVLLCRNPTLMRGSILRLFITKIKTDLNDPSTTLSILVINPLNADFDGDAVAVMMCLDNEITDACYAFAPHQNLMDVGTYRGLTNAPAIPKQLTGNINNWHLMRTEQPTTREQENFMHELSMM